MATIARQPFAPLDGARLQSLTSLKNRQNAISNTPSIKRKASEVLDADDFENVDPSLFSKRTKGEGAGADTSFAIGDFFKPSAFVLTKAASTSHLINSPPPKIAPTTTSTASRARAHLQPKSPAARLNTNIAVSSPLTAPAGRSPTRGSKRIGILSRRRTQRVDPPSFGLGSAGKAPFSLDAALKGTIPSYSGLSNSTSRGKSSAASSLLQQPAAEEMKASWFFEIHEDTPEQEMTNLLQHSTCTLEISSDEESEQKRRRESAEGRDKENIPPADDVSQTSSLRAARAAAVAAAAAAVALPENADDMIVEKSRGPLVEMNAADYYAEGCDGESVVVIPDDEDDDQEAPNGEIAPLYQDARLPEDLPLPEDEDDAENNTFELAAPPAKLDEVHDDDANSIDVIMGKDEPATKAALLEPIEGTGQSFELWESNSAKDAASAPGSPTSIPAEDVLE
ncbi:hypothetical protein QBC46DRAFT_10503 [Diplogelasinospora grovesii]|uniref:Thymidylate kinase n=1 Tax=Diplogelasinospora grovesii TaxID=303347 RepID=A0AAN6N1R0_9PEZI|nr:hypothetical protein QBC46DRAFT_10503 [Diplogelasinospora grovesii]